MFIASAVGGVMLFFVCRSMFKVWKLGFEAPAERFEACVATAD